MQDTPYSRGRAYSKYQQNTNDEYYTLYEDIEKHFNHVLSDTPDIFEDKVIYCPCDDFDESSFPKYFMDNRIRFKWKRLICTSYCKPSMFDGGNGKCVIVESDGAVDKFNLHGSGDFRSIEVQKYFDESDIIVTNPPFSISSSIYPKVINKKFSIIAFNGDITQKLISDHIFQDKVFLDGHCGRFIMPDGKYIQVGGSSIIWISNLLTKDYKRDYEWNTMKENLTNNDKFICWLRNHNLSINEYPYLDNNGYIYPYLLSNPI